jgi:MutS domain I
MLKHWREMKAQHRNAILFYRVGDFYEMFNEDAELAARILDIALTSRGDGVPLAGVPVKAAAEYLRQLVGAGHRVAICEQVEDPKLARGLVRREVVETITPGALLQDGWVAGSRNNWLVALQRGSGEAGKRGSRPNAIRAKRAGQRVLGSWTYFPASLAPRFPSWTSAPGAPNSSASRFIRSSIPRPPPGWDSGRSILMSGANSVACTVMRATRTAGWLRGQ